MEALPGLQNDCLAMSLSGEAQLVRSLRRGGWICVALMRNGTAVGERSMLSLAEGPYDVIWVPSIRLDLFLFELAFLVA